MCDAQLALTSDFEAPAVSIVNGLQRMGCFCTGNMVSQAVVNRFASQVEEGQSYDCPDSVRSARAEAAWRCGQWDAQLPAPPLGNPSFQESLFCALRSFFRRDVRGVQEAVLGGTRAVGRGIDADSLKAKVIQLQCLNDVYRAAEICTRTQFKWPPWVESKGALSVPYVDVELLESVRFSICSIINEPSLWAKFVELSSLRAMEGGHPEIAEHRFLRFAHEHPVLAQKPFLQLVHARLKERNGDFGAAIDLLRATSPVEKTFQAQKNFLLASWARGYSLMSSADIVQDLTSATKDADGFLLLATCCDQLYGDIRQRKLSPEYAALSASVRQSISDLQELSSIGRSKTDKANQRRETILRRTIERFQKDAEALAASMNQYRSSAVVYYATFLRMSSEQESAKSLNAIFRALSLWLADGAALTKEESSEMFKVPMFRFIPVRSQLVARLRSSKNRTHYHTVVQLLSSMFKTLPHHLLWHLLSLGPADSSLVADEEVSLVEMMKKSYPDAREIILQAESLREAYLEFAEYRPSSSPGAKVDLPSSCKLARVANYNLTPVPTLPLPAVSSSLDGTRVTDVVPTVASFAKTFEIAGGLSAPKCLSCITSHGTVERQLLKSKTSKTFDDLRQDALIEQIFETFNGLMASDGCRGHRIELRTYCVVPLASTTGIVQWVGQTESLKEYLVGDQKSRGAHARYFPKAPPENEIQLQLKGAQDQGTQLQEFMNIQKQFPPAMHYFFLERFTNPREWHLRQRAYVYSCAANSIAGYIVGLGDRHVSNILIDKRSGELVHIDMGVAFDAARLLPMPENVPFRLTSDIVDGMGIHAVEGPFRSCCEAVLSLAREHKELLHTILEATVHDPLATWAVQPGEGAETQLPRQGVIKKQQSEADANRTVARVREKLLGYEDGEYFNVDGHVRKLINAARSSELLSRMYIGWSPHL
jgi:ataxia telangiectasia mutated family protein